MFEVQFSTATLENQMRKSLKVLSGAALTMCVVGAAVATFKPQQYEPVRNFLVEMRVDSALSKIYQLTADQLINDEVIRSAVRGGVDGYLYDVSRKVRETVFEQHQCPAFGLGMYDDVESVCYNARYSEGQTVDNYWYDELGIPLSIAEQIAEMRVVVYGIGREYLQTPENLQAVFNAKSDVAIDEFGKLSSDEKVAFTTLVVDIVSTLEEFLSDADARIAHAEYLKAEEAWRASWDLEERTSVPYEYMTEKGEQLRGVVENMDLYLFVARRHAEGGDDLVTAYLDGMRKLLAQIIHS